RAFRDPGSVAVGHQAKVDRRSRRTLGADGPTLDQCRNPAGGHGAREQEALAEIAFEIDQAAGLLLRLNAFGDDFDAEASSEVDHGPHDRIVIGVDGHAFYEALVDLEQVDPER